MPCHLPIMMKTRMRRRVMTFYLHNGMGIRKRRQTIAFYIVWVGASLAGIFLHFGDGDIDSVKQETEMKSMPF